MNGIAPTAGGIVVAAIILFLGGGVVMPLVYTYALKPVVIWIITLSYNLIN